MLHFPMFKSSHFSDHVSFLCCVQLARASWLARWTRQRSWGGILTLDWRASRRTYLLAMKKVLKCRSSNNTFIFKAWVRIMHAQGNGGIIHQFNCGAYSIMKLHYVHGHGLGQVTQKSKVVMLGSSEELLWCNNNFFNMFWLGILDMFWNIQI